MKAEDVYLVKYLETLKTGLDTAKAEAAYLKWLVSDKMDEIAEKEANYEKLGNMLADRGLVEKSL